jgi:catechol 2,3-dioxygenase-like lactoylglutathione lyase family enzyme
MGIGVRVTRSSGVTPLGFTKLIVDDLDKCAAFYAAVCGLVEESRAEDQIAGRPIEELYFTSDPPGTGTFTLTKFLDAPARSEPGVILGFVTEDVDAFVDRARAAGAGVVEAAQSRPEFGVKVAFVNDLEGNLLEVVELLAP